MRLVEDVLVLLAASKELEFVFLILSSPYRRPGGDKFHSWEEVVPGEIRWLPRELVLEEVT